MLIGVIPKNYRQIVMYVLEHHQGSKVYCNKKLCTDYSTDGNLTQSGIKILKDFLIIAGNGKELIGFHDHPNEMWLSTELSALAKYCENQGWLKIESI